MTHKAPAPGQAIAPGFVYVVKAGRSVKIGFSTRPVLRFPGIQTGNPKPLTPLCVFPGSRATERHIRRAFKDLQEVGEWLAYGPALREFVKGVRAAGERAPEWVYAWLRDKAPVEDAPGRAPIPRPRRRPRQADLCRDTGHFPEVLRAETAALYLGLPVQEVRTRLREGSLPGVRLGGGHWRLSKSALDGKLAADNMKKGAGSRK